MFDSINSIDKKTPVTVLTGFLGSGKSTLLNTLIRSTQFSKALVIINEFGEVGLDHLLIVPGNENQVVQMNNGCICCTIQSDLKTTLKDMMWRFSRQGHMQFDRVIIETTGLADPAPIVHTLIADEWLLTHYRLEGIVTTVDAVNGMATLDAQPESIKQVALADRLLLTKTDLATPSVIESLMQRIHLINPNTPPIKTTMGDIAPSLLNHVGLYDTESKRVDVEHWLNLKPQQQEKKAFGDQKSSSLLPYDSNNMKNSSMPFKLNLTQPKNHLVLPSKINAITDKNRHDDRIRAHCFSFDMPFSPTFFDDWLMVLFGLTGDAILRIKGIVHVEGKSKPIVVHGVQHIFHPPLELPDWPSEDRRTHVVFITRDVGRDVIERIFNGLKQHTSLV